MKISQFASNYNLKIRTVRYYVDRALLNPKKINNQYIFDETCAEEMERILLYKKLRFTLQEIELLFFLEKTSNLKDEEINSIITDILEQKKLEITNEIKDLQQIHSHVSHEIEKHKSIVTDSCNGELSMPISFIQNLVCPLCGQRLFLSNAHISSDSIYSGVLTCSCEYKALLSNGIILCDGHLEDTPFKVFNNVKSVLSIADEYSDSYRMLVDKAYSWLYHNLPAIDSNSVVLLGPFTANFLLKYRNKVNTNATYVIIDPSLKRLQNMQKYLKGFEATAVFIAGEIHDIPLRKGCVDCYIDDFSTINSIFTYNNSKLDCITSFMKPDCDVTGILNDYSKATETLVNVKKSQVNFDHRLMTMAKVRESFVQNMLQITTEHFIGETNGMEKHMPYNICGEQLRIIGYTARRR